MTRPIKIEIRPNWDLALTYEFLDRPASITPVFVGRRDLLDPIVAAIVQREKSGTFLISGYRGTGKTTLLIEALREAQEALKTPDRDWRLFPLVLNASEVSASLEPDATPGSPHLTIDPRRLLMALLRALKNRVRFYEGRGETFPSELRTTILDTYAKAAAAEYKRATSTGHEESRSLTWESSLQLRHADAYKVFTWFAAVAAIGLEGFAWLGPGAGALHAVSVALAGTSIASFIVSRKLTRSSTDVSAEQISLKFDNSLHQLENDLKDMLAQLQEKKMRTVVVLEELDKIQDEQGEQLDAVIRYFKNLFTQAPGLFFFVTDKAYFDLISSKIKRARRQRSYAIEHTFFTHRVFVGRPTMRDCLDYLKEVVADGSYREKINSLSRSAESREKGLDRMDPFVRFVRVLLFLAANHLFDLKNEMRRYIRATKGSRPDELANLTIDDQSFPEEEAALAVFHDLVEEKARSFAFGIGRTYANEVLHDCLYAVFNELGSTRAQKISDFYPHSGGGPEPASGTDPKQAELLLEDQLELTDAKRIVDAVNSLVEHLHRGGSFERADFAQGEFVWKMAAARAFRSVRRLEKHEEDFVSALKHMSAAAAAFGTGGVLSGCAGDADRADNIVRELEGRVTRLQDVDDTLPVETALSETEKLQSQVAEITGEAYTQHLKRLEEFYGISFVLIGTSAQGGGLHVVRGVGPGKRSAVLVAQGVGSSLADDFRNFVEQHKRLNRLSVIHVLHAPAYTDALEARRQWWANEKEQSAVPALTTEVLPLDEGLSGSDITERWGEVLGKEMLFREYWSAVASVTPYDPKINPVVKIRHLAELEAEDSRDFVAAVRTWVETGDRLLWLVPSSDRFRDALFPLLFVALTRPEFTEVAVVAINRYSPDDVYWEVGERLLRNAAEDRVLDHFKIMKDRPRLDLEKEPEAAKWEALAIRVKRVGEQLVNEGRVILALASPIQDSDDPGDRGFTLEPAQIRAVLGESGRGVVVSSEPANDLRDLGITRVDVPLEEYESVLKKLGLMRGRRGHGRGKS